METVFESTHWFGKRFPGECRAQAALKILSLVLLEKLDALMKGIQIVCGAGMWVKVITQAIGWHTVNTNVNPWLRAVR